MMYDYFSNLVTGIEEAIQKNPEARSPRKMYALEVARIGQRLYSGKDKVAWCGITVPFDLLSAMGVTSCFVEFIGAMLAGNGIASEFIETAEQKGYPREACGYHRAVMGAAIKGVMPEPDFFIGSSCPCSGGLAVVENLAKHFNKDLFVLNIPQEPTPDGITYLARQLRQMAEFVSDHTGIALDGNKVRQAMEWTNQTREILMDVYRLIQHVPSPANGRLMDNFGIVMPLIMGSAEGVDVAKIYRDTFATRVRENRPGVPNERLRLLWIQNRIQFKNPIIDVLEKDYGAAVISDELNAITWDPIDPDDPFPGLARRAISIPFNGPTTRRIDHLKKLAMENHIDGAINPCNWGCRQGAGSRGLIAAGLKEIGVPVLNLEVDCVDSRNFFEGQFRTRIEAFVELLETNKKRKSV